MLVLFLQPTGLRLYAAVAVESVLDQVALRVEIVQHHISVRLMTGSEDDNLEELVRCSETLDRVGPNVDTSIHRLPTRKRHRQDDIRIIRFRVIHTMYQSFVEIEYDGLLVIMMARWQADHFVCQVGDVWCIECVDVLDGLQCLYEVCLMQLVLRFFRLLFRLIVVEVLNLW